MSVKKKYKVNDRPLKPVTTSEQPSYWLFFDTETSQKIDGVIEVHTFQIGWTCFWDRKTADPDKEYTWKFWDDSKKLCRYIHGTTLEYNKITLVGHNIYFDLQVCGFFEYFTRKHWQVAFIYDRQGAYILKCKLYKKIIIALSTTNWFDVKLATLGEIVGLRKLDIDFETASYKRLIVYCRRDVRILVRIVRYYLDFITDNRMGKFSFSKASQAFTAYRYRFLKAKIRLHRDEKVIALERAAYKGGRCEAFHIGQCPGRGFTTLDINSMYPYVMKKYTYPVKLVDYHTNVSINYLRHILERFHVIVQVDLSTKQPAYAVHHKGKTVFPVGEFEAELCTQGAFYALEHNHIKNIKQIAVYTDDDIFSEYVDFFYNLKTKYTREGNKSLEIFCKYMLNSLYGKWGQKFQLEERKKAPGIHDYYREEILDIRTGKMVIKTYLMNQLIIRYGETEGRNAFVAIAAHVTENARMELWNLITHIGQNRVIYCDTDSVKVRTSDMGKVKNLIQPNKLGMLKVENTSKKLFIGGAKWYVTEDTQHIKGIPQNAKELEPGVYEFFTWPKMTYHLREGIITGYHRKRIQRRLNINYEKGTVLPGGRVIPLRFPLSQEPF